MESTEHINQLVQKIWDYHFLNQPLEKADVIFALGSYDTRVAQRAAELYLEGYAPLVIFSGGLGRNTSKLWKKSEAETFAEVAEKMGVPHEAIILETNSTNTSENVLFTRQLLEDKGIKIKKVLAIQKPYAQRRMYATIRKRWPEVDVVVTSPQLTFEQYLTNYYTREKVINNVVGDLQRIKLYSKAGFQISQDIPDDVWKAYEELVKLGYDKQLSKETF